VRYLPHRRLLSRLAGAVVLFVIAGSVVWFRSVVAAFRGPQVISAGVGPSDMALSRDGQTLYVADYGVGQNNSVAGDTVTPVSLRTGRAGRPIKVGDLPVEVTIAPAAGVLYVVLDQSFGTGNVVPVDLATGVARPPMKFPGGADGVLLSPDQRTLYVWDYAGVRHRPQLVPVDVATGRRGTPVSLPVNVGAIALSPDGRTLYEAIRWPGAHPHGGVVPVDPQTGQAGTPIWLPYTPDTLTVSPDGRRLYGLVSLNSGGPDYVPGPQWLYVIDLARGKLARSVALPEPPTTLAVSPDGRTLYIQNVDKSITPVSTATWHLGAALRTTPRLSDPHVNGGNGDSTRIVISPDGRTLYAINGTGIAVIPLNRD
jgi:hyaluronoglucosaminidase